LLGAAEQFTTSFVPLLTLAAAMLYALAARRFGARVAVVATGLVLTIMHFTTQMAPMRIDHHGWQIICVL
jgi:ABC-type transport system involved in cytochrome bd biosynthesis fused ATPase/permease subunit